MSISAAPWSIARAASAPTAATSVAPSGKSDFESGSTMRSTLWEMPLATMRYALTCAKRSSGSSKPLQPRSKRPDKRSAALPPGDHHPP